MDTFEEEVIEEISGLDDTLLSNLYSDTLEDGIECGESFVFHVGKIVRERMRLSETLAPTTTYGLTLLESVGFADVLRAAWSREILETIETSDQLRLLFGATIVEKLRLTEQWGPGAIYGMSLTETLRISDLLARMAFAEINEVIELTDAQVARMRAQAGIVETVELDAALSPQLIFAAVVHDTVAISDTELINMIFSGRIVEDILISGGIFNPGGGFTAWAMNTRTGAVTEYANFDFNSYVELDGRYYATNDDGLYELGGGTDDGEDIVSVLRSGFMQFGGTRQSRLKAAYLATRGAGDYVLKIETGEGQTYVYVASTRNMRTAKVHMGKGQRARYFAFELISTGQAFDLDSLEFVPIVLERRV